MVIHSTRELQSYLNAHLFNGQPIIDKCIKGIKSLLQYKKELSEEETIVVVRTLFCPFVTHTLMKAEVKLSIKMVQLVLWWMEHKSNSIPGKPLVEILIAHKQFAVQNVYVFLSFFSLYLSLFFLSLSLSYNYFLYLILNFTREQWKLTPSPMKTNYRPGIEHLLALLGRCTSSSIECDCVITVIEHCVAEDKQISFQRNKKILFFYFFILKR